MKKVILIVVFLLFISNIKPDSYKLACQEPNSRGLYVFNISRTYTYNMVYITTHKGISMLPTIENNSKCLCIPQENYIVNDVVVFSYGNNNIAHRIIGKEDSYFITKGDNNRGHDTKLQDKENILCKIPFAYNDNPNTITIKEG